MGSLLTGFPPDSTGPARVLGAVLCGGQSRRFGSDKALADAGGRPLASWVVEALRQAGADPVVAVGGTAGVELGLPTVADRAPGEGPLAALATVLLWARSGLVVVAPCDLPLLRAEHVLLLIEAARQGGPAVAEIDGTPQPSLACWPASIGPAVQRLVAGGQRSWRAALDIGPWIGVVLPPEAMIDADTPASLAAAISHRSPPPHEGV